MATAVIGVILDGRGEEGVDKGSLSESRLAGDLSFSLDVNTSGMRSDEPLS